MTIFEDIYEDVVSTHENNGDLTHNDMAEIFGCSYATIGKILDHYYLQNAREIEMREKAQEEARRLRALPPPEYIGIWHVESNATLNQKQAA